MSQLTATHRGIYFIPTPLKCDLCGEPFGEFMFDAGVRTMRAAPWACMCEKCFSLCSGRLGIGSGQKYEQREDGKFWQIEGGSYGKT